MRVLFIELRIRQRKDDCVSVTEIRHACQAGSNEEILSTVTLLKDYSLDKAAGRLSLLVMPPRENARDVIEVKASLPEVCAAQCTAILMFSKYRDLPLNGNLSGCIHEPGLDSANARQLEVQAASFGDESASLAGLQPR